LPLSFHKRNTEVPLTKFLPLESSAADRRHGNHAGRTILSDEIAVLEAAARESGTSFENLLLAGLVALLNRLTRQDTIVIVAGTSQLQFNLEAETSLATVLLAMRSPSNDGAPSEVVRQPFVSSRKISGNVVRYDFEAGNESAPDVDDCALLLSVRDNGSRLELSSPAGPWTALTLDRWLGYLLALLTGASSTSDTPVSDLPLWDESVAREFYRKLNGAIVDFPGEPTVPDRFTAQARRRPDATAVVAGLRRYTYRELETRSTELARYLVSLGAGPGRAVAICMERTVDLPMTLLAVLKSGSFYVPLEPSHPYQRLRGILDECQPVALLTNREVVDLLRGLEQNSMPLISVDGLKLKAETLPLLPPASTPDDLAYTIYTSGTTGKPKGVRITHGSLLNLICAMQQKPGMSETDRTLASAPISFDIATMDMFLTICSGGTLVIASRHDAADPYRLAHLIEEHEITSFQATPATWRLLITSRWSGKRGLKMLCGGEALSRELANELMRIGGELWNCYGPTETTIWSSVIRLKKESGIVPVGPPMANTSFYVVNNAGHPLPPGVPGELCIGGVGVSPGYVAQPELTAERFIPDRFGPDPSRFLFRTGDLVRLVDGNQFEFFGRLDHQVKLRGYRIELGEIESVLRGHPSIADAVVMLREDIPGEPRLVAYVIVPDNKFGTTFDTTLLIEFAAKSLPEYMLPTAIVQVDRFPLSTSGKIDRRALPVPESVSGQAVPIHPAAEDAADELEEKLLTIFRETLRNDSIGVTDSFFRYGGYSLLTIRLFARIDRELHARLPISLLFDAPTVRELARVIRKGIVPSTIVPIRPHGRSAPIFLIQSYLLYNAMLEMVEPDRPVYGVRELGDEREPMNVAERARQFCREILAVCPEGPLYLAGWCAAGTLTVEIARQLREGGHQVGLVALFDAERPGFAPARGLTAWLSRLWKKVAFHWVRLRQISWRERLTYIGDAVDGNWEWAVDHYYAISYRVILWLQRHFNISLSGTAYHHVHATMSALKDLSVRPYPGKLNLYRAADVPDRTEADATLGWSVVARDGVDVQFVSGDHLSMFRKPYVDSLAGLLQREMRRHETAVARG